MKIPPRPPASVLRLADEACASEGVTLNDLVQYRRCRSRSWVRLRQRVVYRMRNANPQPSFPEIAAAMGMGCHSSVIASYRREEREKDVGNQPETNTKRTDLVH